MSKLAAPTNDLRTLIASDKFKEQVALSLPSHMTPDRFARVALTALTKTPALLACSKESLLRCLMDCSSLGLEPDGRHAHLIPYKDTCTLIIDWKGLVALAKRSGSVSIFRAELVKELDEFSWVNRVVSHSINWRSDRGKTQAVYSYVKFTDGEEDWEVMTLSEVEAIRKRSKSGNNGPWVTDFDEMAKKTVIRRHSKRLTLSPEFADALEKDDDRNIRDVGPSRAAVPAMFQEVPTLQEQAPEYATLQADIATCGFTWEQVAENARLGGLQDVDPTRPISEQHMDDVKAILEFLPSIIANLKGGS